MSEDIPLAAIARVPGLVIRLVFSALRFKRRARKSARKLRRAMIKGGMDRERAKQLAARYEESVRIRRIIGKATGKDFSLSSLVPFL